MRGLKEIREAHLNEANQAAQSFTQEAVAAVIGVTAPTYRSYERDPGKLTREKAEKLAEYLGCSIDDIFLSNERN